LMDKAFGFTPYHFSWGNPLIHRDYDGRWPWGIIAGAATGAAISVAFQSVEILADEDKSFENDFSFSEVGISAVSGAVAGLTGGLTMGINNQTAKIGAELLIDATLSAGAQYATTGEVDLITTGISTVMGKVAGGIVAKQVEKGPAYKFLEKASDRAKRIAKKGNRAQKKKNAENAEAKKTKYINNRSVSSSTATSTAVEIISENAEDEDEK
ncbi:hypothetical protein IT397_02800, partial [Candidatus Nomurabacteria bacterium]|nr:hypothetical protein [Candidatus Nomurabacteria bacterium]